MNIQYNIKQILSQFKIINDIHQFIIIYYVNNINLFEFDIGYIKFEDKIQWNVHIYTQSEKFTDQFIERF